MTKPDNLLTGFTLLLIVERRSGNLDHHPDSAVCVFNEACWGCFYHSCVENSVTASLHQVRQVAIRNSRFTALTVESRSFLASPAPVQHVSHVLWNWFFYAAYCINESKFQNLDLICSKLVMDIRKELRNKPQRPWAEQEETKARDLKLIRFGFHNLAVHDISHKTQLLWCHLWSCTCRPSIRYVFLNKHFLIYEMSYGTS